MVDSSWNNLGRQDDNIRCFSVYAIKNDIPTNWLQVIKDHMIKGGFNQARTLLYGVLISKILILQGVDVNGEKKLSCDRSNVSSGSSLALNGDRTNFIPETDFE
ncbi:hypothetical protein V8G54_035943 [Vigna mungo]|uniref:Uncharacterized protein n=1 Tax=Vigna mungo TaxID=3915 RepID=A0AAQ3MFV5_VIGMU